jgi:predicted  nucleic acid-binding Zn-ribbon protein
MSEQNSWNEYSRLVLKELETLAVGISNLNLEIQDVKREIALIKDREDKVDKLQEWKDKVSEIISPSQLDSMVKEIKDLKEYKSKSMAIFAVVQFLMGLIMWYLSYSK